MPRRITGFMAAAALQVVALVLAHDLVYLVRFGSRYGEALVHTGHGETWSTAVGTTLALAAVLLVAGIGRLAQLGILVERARTTSVRRSDATPAGALDVRQLARIWLRIAPRMALVGVVLLTVQESLERSALDGSVAGPGILLSAEYPWALWITIAVGRGRRPRRGAVRMAQARASSSGSARPAPRRPRPQAIAAPRRGVPYRPVASVLGRRSGLRAPPQPSPA